MEFVFCCDNWCLLLLQIKRVSPFCGTLLTTDDETRITLDFLLLSYDKMCNRFIKDKFFYKNMKNIKPFFLNIIILQILLAQMPQNNTKIFLLIIAPYIYTY